MLGQFNIFDPRSQFFRFASFRIGPEHLTRSEPEPGNEALVDGIERIHSLVQYSHA
jgi:hypothetical protein